MESLPPLPTPAGIIDQALNDLGIRTKHSDACLAEAQHWLDNSGLDDPALVDLTHLPFVTIDNPDSRDLDQALVIESNQSGYRIRYALADAAYYIRPGSALFAEALERGSTYYTPLMAVPMLPTVLSEGLVSLNPDGDRRALVFDMQLDADACAVNTAIVRARIHSKAKLDYQGVQNWLNQHNKASKPNSQSRPEPYHESLCLLEQVGKLLVAKGTERGVVNFDRVETRIDILQGSAHFPEYREPHFEATTRERYDTERFNEQISLLCNMQGAELLLAVQGASDAMQAVYRVHEAPLQKNLKTLRTTLDAIADLQEYSQRWRWGASQNLADYVQSLPDAPQFRRQVKAIQRQIMQAQRASVFRPEPGEHHALKAAIYARFSAPMREIVGIYTHKELLEALSGTAAAAGPGMNNGGQDSDEQLREAVIISANAARQRQRQLDKIIEFAALFSVFSRELSVPAAPVHAGTLVGIRQDRLYASLDDMATDIKLYQDDLETQFNTSYRFDDAQAVAGDPAKPTWRLGQGVALSVRHYDKQRRRFAFSVCAL